jgi:hypothetical protein
VNRFFLFKLNAHNILSTYIYYQVSPTCFGFCYTIFRETIAFLAQKLYAFCNVALKCTIYSAFSLIHNTVTLFIAICVSSFCVLKILKMSVKILNCNTYCLYCPTCRPIWLSYMSGKRLLNIKCVL